jgi:hypothetical protein
VVGPVYKGTLSTMRDIMRQEGITVRLCFWSRWLRDLHQTQRSQLRRRDQLTILWG